MHETARELPRELSATKNILVAIDHPVKFYICEEDSTGIIETSSHYLINVTKLAEILIEATNA